MESSNIADPDDDAVGSPGEAMKTATKIQIATPNRTKHQMKSDRFFSLD